MRNHEQTDYKYCTIITTLLYMILFASCVAGQNLVPFFGLRITTGMLIFPLTYILIAISTELYGTRKTREIIFCSAFSNFVMIFILFIFAKIPSDRSYVGDSSLYHSFTNRLSYMMLVSTIAFLISENINVWIISRLRTLTNGSILLVRTFLATAFAIIIDTWLVFPLYLTRQADIGSAILETFIVMLVKLSYDVALLPIFWIVIEFINYRNRKDNDILPEYAKPFTSSYYFSVDHSRAVE